jgi:TetR/AcrR family transcriptional regulator
MVTQPRSMSKKDRRLESERMIMVAAEKVFAEAGFGGATM